MHKFSAGITAFLLAFGIFSFSNVLNVSAINDDNEQIVEDITGNTENEMDNNSDNTESDVSKFEGCEFNSSQKIQEENNTRYQLVS